jgi:protein-disulfide isomerase
MRKSGRIGVAFTISLVGVVTVLLAGLGGCGPSPSQFEKSFKAFLEKNPQFLEKEIEKVMQKKRPAADTRSIDEMIKNPVQVDLNDAPIQGAANAPITIVEFSDFQCPFCSRVTPTMKTLLKDYPGKVRIAFRHNPLPFHKNAMSAAKASLAANEQGKFWEMHDALFSNQKDLSDESIKKAAKQIGLDVRKFEKAWKSNQYDAQIQRDVDFAKKNGATGTPSFFINGVFLRGARPVESFKEVIDKLLAQPQQPTPAANPEPGQKS